MIRLMIHLRIHLRIHLMIHLRIQKNYLNLIHLNQMIRLILIHLIFFS